MTTTLLNNESSNNESSNNESSNKAELQTAITEFPWTKEDIANILSRKMHGIDYYTLGPRLYTEFWGTLKGLDTNNTIKNILISEDGETLLVITDYTNKGILPDTFSYQFFLKYRKIFNLKFCAIDEINIENENNHIMFNNKIYNKLYVAPENNGNLNYDHRRPVLLPNEKIPD